jgi:hypothetical protein
LAEFEAEGITDLAQLTAARLAATVDALPDDAAQAFPLLAALPAPDFTRDVAAALFETTRARSILENLARADLLTELGSARYRLPHFIRTHARERAGSTEARADRLAGYYLNTAIAADLAGGERLRRSLIPEPSLAWSLAIDRLDWLDHNREALGALVEEFYRTGRDEQACQLCTALENLVFSRKRYDLCLTAFEFGADAARRLGNRPALLARLLSLQGRVCVLLQLLDRARPLLAEAADLAAGDAQLEASIAEFTGLYDQTAGDNAQAAAHYTRAAEIDRRSGDERAYGIHARMRANVLVMLGRTDEAMRELADIDRYLFDDRNRSRVAAVRAKVQAVRGDLVQATAQLELARRFAEQSKSLAAYREELDDIEAEIAYRAGDYGAARSIWGRLIQEALAAHHPKSAIYQAKLNWLPPLPLQ